MLLQEEDFDEDEGIYDEFHLDEEEEKFGLAADDVDSVDSDNASEGSRTSIFRRNAVDHILEPLSRPTKKHDEESVASSKRDDSPILKKASVSLQLRS